MDEIVDPCADECWVFWTTPLFTTLRIDKRGGDDTGKGCMTIILFDEHSLLAQYND